jgi:hypothetical protein
MKRVPANPMKRASAFTLTELLLAMAITVVVGAATVAMLNAAAYGSTSRSGMRDLVVLSRTVSARIGLTARTAVEIVGVDATSGEYVVLWVADANDDATKQYKEMQLIERHSASSELRSYTSTSDNTNYSTLAAFRTAALASFTSATWATGISDVEFKLLAASGSNGPLLSWQVTATRNSVSDTAVGAVAMRNTTPTP